MNPEPVVTILHDHIQQLLGCERVFTVYLTVCKETAVVHEK